MSSINLKKSACTQSFFQELEDSESKTKKWIKVADNFEVLLKWLREDILSSIGTPFEHRKALFLWVLAELQGLEKLESGNHIKKLRIKLYNQLDELLSFVERTDQMKEMTASFFNTDLLIVRRLYEMQKLSDKDPLKITEELSLHKELRKLYYPLEQEVKWIIKKTYRASSIVENINSKLRNYFFLRKSFKQGSLDLLRFYFNHKIFIRSAHPERIGKSPAELLYEKPHPHWLEMLGFTRFKQAVA